MPKGVVNCGNCEEPTIFGVTFSQLDLNKNGYISSEEQEELGTISSSPLPTVQQFAIVNEAMSKRDPADALDKQEFAEAAALLSAAEK